MYAHDRLPTPTTAHATTPLWQRRIALLLVVTTLGLLSACSNVPGVRLMDSDNSPIEVLTIDVGETVEIIARTSR